MQSPDKYISVIASLCYVICNDSIVYHLSGQICHPHHSSELRLDINYMRIID